MNHMHVLNIAQKIETLLTKEFLDWLPENFHVWDAFCEQAFSVRNLGFKHYSARTIIHFLRHYSAVTEKSGPWKINNNYSPYLARLFDHCFPNSAGLWEYRETKKAKADHDALAFSAKQQQLEFLG